MVILVFYADDIDIKPNFCRKNNSARFIDKPIS